MRFNNKNQQTKARVHRTHVQLNSTLLNTSSMIMNNVAEREVKEHKIKRLQRMKKTIRKPHMSTWDYYLFKLM